MFQGQACLAVTVQIGYLVFLVAIRNLREGQELLAWYGKHTNDIIGKQVGQNVLRERFICSQPPSCQGECAVEATHV